MFFSNGDVHEKFTVHEHYIGLASNYMAPSFHVNVKCYVGYMVLVCTRDMEHPNPIWLITTLLSPYFVPTNPNYMVRVFL